MLVSLQIRDFAIVDRVEVELMAGMTVLTGETGAGKSILVDALGLVLGERGGAQLVRSGARRAEFSAEFNIAGMSNVTHWLEEQSLDDDDECLLRRIINADGRSRAFINGNTVPMQQLKSIGEQLVDIHGQHFHQSLGRQSVQRDLLDHHGGLLTVRNEVSTAFVNWQGLAERLRQLSNADIDRASRIDLLTFQLQELRTHNIEAGEIDTLQQERQRLANSGRLIEGVQQATSSLFDADVGNANSLVADATRSIEALVTYDEALGPIVSLLQDAGIQISEASDALRRYADTIDIDPQRRNEVEDRLDALQTLARKHRVSVNDLAELRTGLETEYDELANADARSQELETQVADAWARYRKLAIALSDGRQQAATVLAAAVTDAMHGLGMPGGAFDIRVARRKEEDARTYGLDTIEFLITANPGQALMPLSRIASGGELSRMSLAIQVIASDGSTIPTMVFDEVDSGVGGAVAEMVGRRLAELASNRQVLCVTHLPQVASLASHHFRIAKVSDGKVTRTNVSALQDNERVEELARMLGGVEITKTTLKHAKEMLSGAPKKSA